MSLISSVLLPSCDKSQRLLCKDHVVVVFEIPDNNLLKGGRVCLVAGKAWRRAWEAAAYIPFDVRKWSIDFK